MALNPASERFLLVLTTAGSADEASAIAQGLVERRLAACVNVVGPVRSVYRWQGAVQQEEERLLLIKTAERLYPELARAIAELHSYEVPEVLAFPVEGGAPSYLEWLGASLLPRS
jgi:periplasmic divalent cation tolerance protein